MADLQQTSSGRRSVSSAKRHTIQFGAILDSLEGHLPVEDAKKHGRSEVSGSVMTYGEWKESMTLCMGKLTTT
jgi:hypothetical protein